MIDHVAKKLTSAELQAKFDLDEDAAQIIHNASGGWAPFADAAVAAVQTTGRSLDELLGSAGLADFVVSHTDDFSLPLSPSDQHALEVLSLLDRFDESVARVAFEVAAERWMDPAWADVPTVLLRLQISGAVTAESEESSWFVPLLIAAWARKSLVHDELEGVSAEVEKSLAEAFTAQLELASSPDSLWVGNAVVLARRVRAWELLDRIFLACGYPLFYRYHRSSVAAFAQLPTPALRAVPELEEVTTVATMVQEALLDTEAHTEAASRELVREQVARLTAPGALRRELGAEGDPEGAPTGRERSGDAGAPSRFHAVMSEMARLGAAGAHSAAAEAGAGWVVSGVVRRPRQIVRLHASIHSVLGCEPGRALALLRSIEDEVKEDSVDGDFLRPAVTAWTALASYLAGDHERADTELVEFARLDSPPFVQEQSFRPAALLAEAYRSLDKLDLSTTEEAVHRMRDYPEMGDLGYHVPIIERLLSQLMAHSRSTLLRSEESIDMHARGVGATGGAAERLVASRISMLISLGQLHRAEMLLEKLPGLSGVSQVLFARSELVAGRNDAAIRIAEAQYYENHVDTRDRADLTGITAAALLRVGDREAARLTFLELLELSALVGTVLPIVQLPLVERQELMRMSAAEPIWQKIAEALVPLAHSARRDSFDSEALAVCMGQLGSLGEAVVGLVDFPMLGRREMTLLEKLDQGASVAEIAHDLLLVQGTVKNNLSSLYRKLGVSGREAAVTRARVLGYLGNVGT
ncbi:MAG: LuxR C-terminal-related transcriptional regulator [Brevibacterium sp.]|nr:LuxR C-terminal-related transcriptional regulator [Brevibacterium sp.]